MNRAELLRKYDNDEELTVAEIKECQRLIKPINHTYGKYGNLARIYLEEHRTAKMWCLAGSLPEYLHNIDKQADEMCEVMYKKLSSLPQYKKSDDFMKNLAIETEIQKRIEEEILSEIVYVD